MDKIIKRAISFLKQFIQRFKLHNRIIDNKLSEPTKEAAKHMNNMHNVIINTERSI